MPHPRSAASLRPVAGGTSSVRGDSCRSCSTHPFHDAVSGELTAICAHDRTEVWRSGSPFCRLLQDDGTLVPLVASHPPIASRKWRRREPPIRRCRWRRRASIRFYWAHPSTRRCSLRPWRPGSSNVPAFSGNSPRAARGRARRRSGRFRQDDGARAVGGDRRSPGRLAVAVRERQRPVGVARPSPGRTRLGRFRYHDRLRGDRHVGG